MTDWGYSEENGPLTWAINYPLAAGTRQSPIDIKSGEVESDDNLQSQPLTVNYDGVRTLQLLNPGYGWKVTVSGDSELVGGPLDGVYKLEQFHCHWGCSSHEGSEHTVDGKSFAGELHLVHWNSTKYSSFSEAAAKPDGLAVLGVFLKEGDHDKEVDKIVSLLKKVTYKGESVDIKDNIHPIKLIPENRAYWTYQGSLTTPPCTESVTWIVFQKPVEVSEKQLKRFRKLRNCIRTRDHDGSSSEDERVCIRNNFRPTLPLNNRKLRECGY